MRRRLGAVAQLASIGELSLLAIERGPRTLAKAVLIDRGEIAELDGVAAARRELMRELGERIGEPIEFERVRFENGCCRTSSPPYRFQ